MGLKSDIKAALLKNVKPAEPKDWKPTDEGEVKLDTLSEDLANAILDFLTDKERCVLKVDKLESVINIPQITSTVSTTVAGAVSPYGGMVPGALGSGTAVSPAFITKTTADASHTGQSSNMAGKKTKSASDDSEVRLRRDNVSKESDKYT
tara:strand:- start:118 stop:567 length:450 start_codon:yes stop_codon:yes gene_type:complete